MTGKAAAAVGGDEPIRGTDVTLDEAAESLTGFEVIGIQKHYGADMSELGGIRMALGTIHALENRDGRRRSWQAVEALTMKQISDYFVKPEDADPDSETGKESSDGE